jgi:hypothetical protein
MCADDLSLENLELKMFLLREHIVAVLFDAPHADAAVSPLHDAACALTLHALRILDWYLASLLFVVTFSDEEQRRFTVSPASDC